MKVYHKIFRESRRLWMATGSKFWFFLSLGHQWPRENKKIPRTRESVPLPPDPMNDVKIFKGWPLKVAPSELV